MTLQANSAGELLAITASGELMGACCCRSVYIPCVQPCGMTDWTDPRMGSGFIVPNEFSPIIRVHYNGWSGWCYYFEPTNETITPGLTVEIAAPPASCEDAVEDYYCFMVCNCDNGNVLAIPASVLAFYGITVIEGLVVNDGVHCYELMDINPTSMNSDRQATTLSEGCEFTRDCCWCGSDDPGVGPSLVLVTFDWYDTTGALIEAAITICLTKSEPTESHECHADCCTWTGTLDRGGGDVITVTAGAGDYVVDSFQPCGYAFEGPEWVTSHYPFIAINSRSAHIDQEVCDVGFTGEYPFTEPDLPYYENYAMNVAVWDDDGIGLNHKFTKCDDPTCHLIISQALFITLFDHSVCTDYTTPNLCVKYGGACYCTHKLTAEVADHFSGVTASTGTACDEGDCTTSQLCTDDCCEPLVLNYNITFDCMVLSALTVTNVTEECTWFISGCLDSTTHVNVSLTYIPATGYWTLTGLLAKCTHCPSACENSCDINVVSWYSPCDPTGEQAYTLTGDTCSGGAGGCTSGTLVIS